MFRYCNVDYNCNSFLNLFSQVYSFSLISVSSPFSAPSARIICQFLWSHSSALKIYHLSAHAQRSSVRIGSKSSNSWVQEQVASYFPLLRILLYLECKKWHDNYYDFIGNYFMSLLYLLKFIPQNIEYITIFFLNCCQFPLSNRLSLAGCITSGSHKRTYRAYTFKFSIDIVTFLWLSDETVWHLKLSPITGRSHAKPSVIRQLIVDIVKVFCARLNKKLSIKALFIDIELQLPGNVSLSAA